VSFGRAQPSLGLIASCLEFASKAELIQDLVKRTGGPPREGNVEDRLAPQTEND
jgi:hypothetical protein